MGCSLPRLFAQLHGLKCRVQRDVAVQRMITGPPESSNFFYRRRLKWRPHGFVPRCSCLTYHLLPEKLITKHMDDRRKVDIVFLHFTKSSGITPWSMTWFRNSSRNTDSEFVSTGKYQTLRQLVFPKFCCLDLTFVVVRQRSSRRPRG